MNCPKCEHQQSRVLESRATCDAMRRRRECLDCRHRFTTYERVEQPVLWVTKHDDRQEPFDRAKLLRGLARACSKRDVPTERLEALVIEIESALRRQRSREVDSDQIGELALAGLLDIDDVAYVRFASVYRAFESIDEFHDEITRLARAAQAATGAATSDEIPANQAH